MIWFSKGPRDGGGPGDVHRPPTGPGSFGHDRPPGRAGKLGSRSCPRASRGIGFDAHSASQEGARPGESILIGLDRPPSSAKAEGKRSLSAMVNPDDEKAHVEEIEDPGAVPDAGRARGRRARTAVMKFWYRTGLAAWYPPAEAIPQVAKRLLANSSIGRIRNGPDWAKRKRAIGSGSAGSSRAERAR